MLGLGTASSCTQHLAGVALGCGRLSGEKDGIQMKIRRGVRRDMGELGWTAQFTNFG